MDKNTGMTRIQLIILVTLVIVIGVLSYPPWAEYRKATQADINVETLALAMKKYYKHTLQYPTSLEQLMTDPNIDGWRGSYLKSIPETPWGGKYTLLQDQFKVGIAKELMRVPEKYRIGGIAEISRVYLIDATEGEQYWW